MINRYEPTHKLTRESNFGHLTGNDRVEVMRGTLARVTIRRDELLERGFTDLRIEEL